MTDMVMLLVALVSFALLVGGWMILPDAGVGQPVDMSVPRQMPEAA